MSFAQWLEQRLVGKDDPLPARVDVIVAIGETLDPDLEGPSPQTKRVAEVAAFSLARDLARAVVFLGRGYSPKVAVRRSEAAAMREVASSVVDLERFEVILEEKSHDTRANIVALKKIMDDHGWKSAVVVTQQLHMLRVRLVCQELMPKEEGYDIRVIAAWSPYGGSSKWIFRNFWTFLLWDRVVAWSVFAARGWISRNPLDWIWPDRHAKGVAER